MENKKNIVKPWLTQSNVVRFVVNCEYSVRINSIAIGVPGKGSVVWGTRLAKL